MLVARSPRLASDLVRHALESIAFELEVLVDTSEDLAAALDKHRPTLAIVVVESNELSANTLELLWLHPRLRLLVVEPRMQSCRSYCLQLVETQLPDMSLTAFIELVQQQAILEPTNADLDGVD